MFSRGREKRGRDSEIVKEGGGCMGEREEERGRGRAKRMKCPRFFLSSSYFLLFFFPLLSFFFLLSISKIRRFTHFEYEVSLRERWLKLWWDFRFLFGGIINGRPDPKSLLPLFHPQEILGISVQTNFRIFREKPGTIFSQYPHLSFRSLSSSSSSSIQKLRNKRTLFSLFWLDIVVQSRD